METATLILSMIIISAVLFRTSVCESDYIIMKDNEDFNSWKQPQIIVEDEELNGDTNGVVKRIPNRHDKIMNDKNHMDWFSEYFSEHYNDCKIVEDRSNKRLVRKFCINKKYKNKTCQHNNLTCEQHYENRTVVQNMNGELTCEIEPKVPTGCRCREMK